MKPNTTETSDALSTCEHCGGDVFLHCGVGRTLSSLLIERVDSLREVVATVRRRHWQPTRDGTYLYVWNALNQLAELHKADNTLIASYFYDYQNRRSRKVTTTAAPQGASTTYYTYDQQNHLIAETGPGNQPIATYVWNDDTLTGFITYQPTRTVYTAQVDQLGSPFQARTLTGTVVWRWESEAYGKTQPNQDMDGDGNKLTLNLRFPGQYYDQESGLHYNWNRYYSPRLARYIEADPVGLDGGLNLYAYVGGNPVSFIDPTGLAYFAVRPLQGLPWLGPLSNNPLDNAMNTAISHEQLFFEDGKAPANQGFFGDSKLKTENLLDGYRRLPGQYNDCVMRMAARAVDTGKYNLATNNCQSWADRVRDQYNKLMQSGVAAEACGL